MFVHKVEVEKLLLSRPTVLVERLQGPELPPGGREVVLQVTTA